MRVAAVGSAAPDHLATAGPGGVALAVALLLALVAVPAAAVQLETPGPLAVAAEAVAALARGHRGLANLVVLALAGRGLAEVGVHAGRRHVLVGGVGDLHHRCVTVASAGQGLRQHEHVGVVAPFEAGLAERGVERRVRCEWLRRQVRVERNELVLGARPQRGPGGHRVRAEAVAVANVVAVKVRLGVQVVPFNEHVQGVDHVAIISVLHVATNWPLHEAGEDARQDLDVAVVVVLHFDAVPAHNDSAVRVQLFQAYGEELHDLAAIVFVGHPPVVVF
mmetsp:Transcript_32625/g.103480  ORF Transcript_32625/g.103480 Transcript_32625/m.103480 type:complete len:278 (+) Transcript_32625:1312-2145(+)